MEQVERKKLSQIGFALFLMITLSVALQLGAGMIGTRFFSSPDESWIRYILVLLPQYFIAVPLSALVLKRVQTEKVQKKSINFKNLGIVILVCFFIMYAGNLAGNIVSAVISAIAQKEMSNIVADLISVTDIWVKLAIVVIIGPVVEELFYRKLLIDRLGRYGQKVAVIASGLIFGLAHGNLSQFFYAFGLGLALGYVYVKTRNVIYTIAPHVIINLLGGVVAPIVVSSGSVFAALYVLPVLGMAIAGLVLFIKNKKRISFGPGLVELEKWRSAFFVNPGMILFLAACAAMFVFNTYTALI